MSINATPPSPPPRQQSATSEWSIFGTREFLLGLLATVIAGALGSKRIVPPDSVLHDMVAWLGGIVAWVIVFVAGNNRAKPSPIQDAQTAAQAEVVAAKTQAQEQIVGAVLAANDTLHATNQVLRDCVQRNHPEAGSGAPVVVSVEAKAS